MSSRSTFPARDTSDCTDSELENPNKSEFWKNYQSTLEKQGRPTMNIADRSLALVDLALRRRFAFIDLEPCFNGAWRSWLKDKVPIDAAFIDDIAKRVADLNYRIETDTSLGRQYRIGHSFFTPHEAGIENATEWYREVIETQVGPLLEEYWYDRLDTAREAKARLLSGL